MHSVVYKKIILADINSISQTKINNTLMDGEQIPS
jgi:hypothetical protein